MIMTDMALSPASAAIIGSPAADGIHCLGSRTPQNVRWEDVGEDAATFLGKSSSFSYSVIGGGARKASDKVLQFNGAGKLAVSQFQVEDFGQLVRSCGNCRTQYKRTIAVSGVDCHGARQGDRRHQPELR